MRGLFVLTQTTLRALPLTKADSIFFFRFTERSKPTLPLISVVNEVTAHTLPVLGRSRPANLCPGRRLGEQGWR